MKKFFSTYNVPKPSISGNAFFSLCHLFEFEEDNKEAFRKVLGKVQITVGETNLHRLSIQVRNSGFVPFDDFFSNVEVNVESCHEFIITLLKHYNVYDSFTYELKIEKAVWSVLMENPTWFALHHKYGDIDHGGVHLINIKDDPTVYRLFCLFNRFGNCHQGDKLRLDLENQKIVLEMFKKVIDSSQQPEDLSIFSNFLRYFHKYNNEFVTILIKEAYDKYVRDILREGRVRFQPKKITIRYNRHGNTELRVKKGKSGHKKNYFRLVEASHNTCYIPQLVKPMPCLY